jgi:hypothetical protein
MGLSFVVKRVKKSWEMDCRQMKPGIQRVGRPSISWAVTNRSGAPQDRRHAGWKRQHVGSGEHEHQGAEGPVAERIQHVAEADGRRRPAREIVQNLGKSLSGFSVRVGGDRGREATGRVWHDLV